MACAQCGHAEYLHSKVVEGCTVGACFCPLTLFIAPQTAKAPDPALRGIGGGPTRVTIIPEESAKREEYPIATGVLDYFPDAIAELARCSYLATAQHHPGEPMRWDRSKSKDEENKAIRHFMQRGTKDKDGARHSIKAAWRMLAYAQKEIEAEQEAK